MVQEVQKLLWQLVCYTGNKSVVMSFVKGCLDNIEVNRYESYLPRYEIESNTRVILAMVHFFRENCNSFNFMLIIC